MNQLGEYVHLKLDEGLHEVGELLSESDANLHAVPYQASKHILDPFQLAKSNQQSASFGH